MQENYVQQYQGTLKNFWRQHAVNFARDLPGVTYEDFVHARNLVSGCLFVCPAVLCMCVILVMIVSAVLSFVGLSSAVLAV